MQTFTKLRQQVVDGVIPPSETLTLPNLCAGSNFQVSNLIFYGLNFAMLIVDNINRTANQIQPRLFLPLSSDRLTLSKKI